MSCRPKRRRSWQRPGWREVARELADSMSRPETCRRAARERIRAATVEAVYAIIELM